MLQIKKALIKYIFHNDENGYSVVLLEDNITAVGNLPDVEPGNVLELEGVWFNHPKFGTQFKFDKFQIHYPVTDDAVIKYLSSGILHGIGAAMAKRIVDKFGADTFNILDNDINQLKKVTGIGKKTLAKITENWKSQKVLRDTILFFTTHNISTNHAIKIYRTYGEKSREIVEKNPYKLISDVWGIGFKTADGIAKHLGISSTSSIRIQAGIEYTLNEAGNSGHVFLYEEDLIKQCNAFLEYEMSKSDPALLNLESIGRIHIEKDKVYLKYLYEFERHIENKLNAITSKLRNSESEEVVNNFFKDVLYSEEQKSAIMDSLNHKVMILTGGPGTGKTTTIKGIIKLYQTLDREILLAAPTGRAAKRMTEVIGCHAQTIHRLLEYNPVDNYFNYNEDNHLEADLIVIDEVSMIDTVLMYRLISAVDEETTILFVGDVDQLPSIGAGNVLNDLIDSDIFPVHRLTKIYRQAEESQIIYAAHEINQGIVPRINNSVNTDMFFIDEPDNSRIPQTILELCEERLPSKFGFDPFTDIQIITPQYKMEVGADNLNSLLQSELNNGSVIYKGDFREFKSGDKVMQLSNNYEKNIFNGDIGIVRRYKKDEGELLIDFENRIIPYKQTELDEITLAYAITVHKSQGSEYPCVIMPVSTKHYRMLQRNLIYTAITRASQMMILIGTKRALSICVRNNYVNHRNTSLFK